MYRWSGGPWIGDQLFSDLSKANNCGYTASAFEARNTGFWGLTLKLLKSYLADKNKWQKYNTKPKIKSNTSYPNKNCSFLSSARIDSRPSFFILYINDISLTIPIQNLYKLADDKDFHKIQKSSTIGSSFIPDCKSTDTVFFRPFTQLKSLLNTWFTYPKETENTHHKHVPS